MSDEERDEFVRNAVAAEEARYWREYEERRAKQTAKQIADDIGEMKVSLRRIDEFRKVQADFNGEITNKILETWRRTELSLYLGVVAVGLLAYIAFFK